MAMRELEVSLVCIAEYFKQRLFGRLAGYGGLSLSVEGPSKAEIKSDEKSPGKIEVAYVPKEPGFYIINLKFADHHVKGSPFTAKVV